MKTNFMKTNFMKIKFIIIYPFFYFQISAYMTHPNTNGLTEIKKILFSILH
jgi:hypothetical protein